MDRSNHAAFGVPLVAVRLQTIEDVQAICRIAYQPGTPAVTRGAGARGGVRAKDDYRRPSWSGSRFHVSRRFGAGEIWVMPCSQYPEVVD